MAMLNNQRVIEACQPEGLFSRSQHLKILNAMSTSGLAGKMQRNSERFPGSNAAIPGVFLHNNFPTRSSLRISNVPTETVKEHCRIFSAHIGYTS